MVGAQVARARPGLGDGCAWQRCMAVMPWRAVCSSGGSVVVAAVRAHANCIDALQMRCRVAGYDNETCNARCRFPRNLQCKVSVPQISTEDTSATSPSLTPLPGLLEMRHTAEWSSFPRQWTESSDVLRHS